MNEYIKKEDILKLLDEAWVDGIEYQGCLLDDVAELPTIQADDDCINRAEAKNCIFWLIKSIEKEHDIVIVDTPRGYEDIESYIDELLNDCESVIPIRPTGEWSVAEYLPKLDNTFSIRCSECGQLMLAHYNDDYPNYCPNCGARMESAE